MDVFEFQKNRCFLGVLMVLAGLLCLGGNGQIAWGGTVTLYTTSAHSGTNTHTTGVDRISMAALNYPTGHCAHCHEQHASVGGSEPEPDNGGADMFLCFRSPYGTQRAGFCLSCHRGNNSRQVGGFITNHDYSQRYGGESKTCPTDVREHFRFINYSSRLPQNNCGSTVGSAHDLTNIQVNALEGRSDWGWGTNRDAINPCMGCHNPHRATADFPCSLPSGHDDNLTWELWGDDAGETMADYAAGRIYQPILAAGGSTIYERTDDPNDATKQPDYNTLCLECHGQSGGLPSNQHGTVIEIEWGLTVKHGRGAADPLGMENGPLRPPYNRSQAGSYVLSCTDCHEPHGSRNEWLLRTEINGVSGIEVTTDEHWFEVCNACHEMRTDFHPGPGTGCGGVCHGHGPGLAF